MAALPRVTALPWYYHSTTIQLYWNCSATPISCQQPTMRGLKELKGSSDNSRGSASVWPGFGFAPFHLRPGAGTETFLPIRLRA